MEWDTEILLGNVVLLGDFNPAIFSPAWLARYGVISDEEARAAEKPVAHPQIAQVIIDHLTITVELNKFSVRMTEDPIVRTLDIATKVFRELLPHTPIHSFGINYAEHWRTDSAERRLALGRALAPTEPWGEWGTTFGDNDPEQVGGMVLLKMRKPMQPVGKGAARITGYLNVEVAPSGDLNDPYRAVLIGTNHHREFEQKPVEGARPIIDLAEETFDAAIAQSRRIISDVKTFAKGLAV